MKNIVAKAHTCAILSRSIYDTTIHFICFYLERVRKLAGQDGTLVHLHQLKAFDTVEHRYLASVLGEGEMSIIFHGSNFTLYSDIE